jgi:hypothetical protein
MARGPAYPYINLEDAIELARKLYAYSKRSPANEVTVLKDAWDYSPTSSSAAKVVAAMSYFGLTEDVAGAQGKEKSTSIRLTDRAYRILVDSLDSPERAKAVKDAFLSPKAYKLCWDKWGVEPPPSMKSTLLFEHGFIDSTVDQFITNYKKSLDFAQMKSDVPTNESFIKDLGEQNGAPSAQPKPEVEVKSEVVGEYAPPKGGGGEANTQHRSLPNTVREREKGMRQEVFTLTEGDVTISWPESISPESFEDFNDWVAILLRKVKRSVDKAEETKSE